MKTSNLDVANLLRSVAASLTLSKANLFEIKAYDNAADSIENLTSEIKDLWQEGKLSQIPGVGKGLEKYLEEYFKTGKVSHFEHILGKYPYVIYQLIKIPGVGPKRALEISKLDVKNLGDLKNAIKTGELIKKGFSEKIAQKIESGMAEFEGRSGRMLLPYAQSQADKILNYLKKSPGILRADPLGSLRRQVATIGDLDFAASSYDQGKVVEYFIKMPGIRDILSRGEAKAAVVLESGLHVDLLVGKPDSYGAMLQHFTGSKNHNIKLRTFADTKGFSLSEYGVRNKKIGKIIPCTDENQVYKLLGMDIPAPQLREDNGEIQAALNHKLPNLIEIKDIKGDLHLHSNFPIEPSHDAGEDSIEEILRKAEALDYQYLGISDHNPALTTHSPDKIVKLIEKRTKNIQSLKKRKKSIRILNGLEIDILSDGNLALPDEALETLDYTIVGIHSGHRGLKEIITARILKALENPFTKILAHPSGRLLNERESYDADWEAVFKLAARNKKLLEINAYPNRLDLRDDLVRLALTFGCKFIINTDAHQIGQMDNMKFGVSVAMRGWVPKKDVVNTWDWKDLSKWFKI